MSRSGWILGAVVCFASCALSLPSPAGVPDPRSCRWVPNVVLGGSTGNPITAGYSANFSALILDIAQIPIPGATVVLDFTAAPGIRLTGVQNAGTTVDCVNRQLWKITDVQGAVAFNPRFSGWENGTNVRLYANGILLAALPARSTAMQVGNPQTDLGAFALVTARFLDSNVHPETDFNLSGGPMDLADFASFAREFLAPRPAQAACP